METSQKSYTSEEVIDITINLLSNINVPVVFSELIGVPILKCIQNLQATKEIMKAEKAQEGVEEDERETEEREADI